jgi:hypothetical protein
MLHSISRRIIRADDWKRSVPLNNIDISCNRWAHMCSHVHTHAQTHTHNKLQYITHIYNLYFVSDMYIPHLNCPVYCVKCNNNFGLFIYLMGMNSADHKESNGWI